MRWRFRSWIKRRTTSAQISSRMRSFDTFLFVNENSLDNAYHYNDTSVLCGADERFRIMERMAEGQDMKADEAEIKLRIFEKVRRRMRELGHDNPFQEASPADVIITPADESLLFEPQNSRASELLSQRYGLDPETSATKECVRVHPVGSRRIIADLIQAGLKIAHGQGT